MNNLPTEYDYKLVPYENKLGRGFVVVRIKDVRILSHWTLPIEDGLELINVVGEKFYAKNLRNRLFSAGEKVLLIPEPDDPYGRDVIGVWDRKQKHLAGHIHPQYAGRIKKQIENKEIAKAIVMWEVKEGSQRVSIRLLLIGPNAKLFIPSI